MDNDVVTDLDQGDKSVNKSSIKTKVEGDIQEEKLCKDGCTRVYRNPQCSQHGDSVNNVNKDQKS